MGLLVDRGCLSCAVGNFDPAEHVALMAVANDEHAGAGHTYFGAIALIFNCDFPVAKRELERGVALDPNSSDAHRWHAWYLARVERDFVAARAELERSQTLDPFYTWPAWAASAVAIAQGDYEAAMQFAERVLTIDPHFLYDEDPIRARLRREGALARWGETLRVALGFRSWRSEFRVGGLLRAYR